jgi:uncharacterized protein (UPF0332 family)
MSNSNQALIRLYVDAAYEALTGARYNLDGGYWTIAASRAYYACLYAISALLLTKDIGRSKHSAVLSTFRQQFVKPGLIETEFSDVVGKAFETRQIADYDMVGHIEESEASTRLDDAQRLVERITRYLREEGYL